MSISELSLRFSSKDLQGSARTAVYLSLRDPEDEESGDRAVQFLQGRVTAKQMVKKVKTSMGASVSVAITMKVRLCKGTS